MRRNHRGYRVGECHHRAKFSDAQVRAMRKRHEGGMGYGALGKLFRCSPWTARDIVTYRTRASA